jgi:antitoxin component YwqK of YwqJK toxin-antitoxin module
VLREFEDHNEYADDFFYYDEKERRIVKTDKPTKDIGMPLHGTYKKMVNGEVTLNGIFFKGTRHGRWEQYNKNARLLDKKKYYEGFARESEISYWDGAQTKIREVIPIHFGYKEGTYLRFYESGRLAEKGTFKENAKIGLWVEFFDRATKNNTKKQTKFPDDPFEETAPVVIKEWDEKGNQTIGKSDEWKDQHKHKKGKKGK